MDRSINDYSPLEQHLLDDFQRNMPLSPAPFADMASELGVSENEVLEAMKSLQDSGAVSRVGPVFTPNRIGVSTLAALSVPDWDLERVAHIVNSFSEVNHNYQREHEYNLWFVVTASSDEHLGMVLDRIEQDTGFAVMSLPMLKDYFIDLGFKLKC